MGDTQLNERQRKAVKADKKNILVSASAGTGKTTTLCTRILDRVKRGELSLDRVLVSTFTEESAADLRRKMGEILRKELEKANDPKEKELLRAQLRLLPIAAIGTIDSFCNSIVRSNFDRLGLSPRMRVPDKSEMSKIKERVMRGVINDFYKSKGGEFERMTDAFLPSYVDTKLPAKFIELYESLSILGDGIDSLVRFAQDRREAATAPFSDGKFGRYIVGKNETVIDFLIDEYKLYLDFLGKSDETDKAIEFDLKWLEELKKVVSDPEKVGQTLDGYAAEKASLTKRLSVKSRKCREYTRVKLVKDAFKVFDRKETTLITGFTAKSRTKYLEYEASMLELLHELLKEYEQRLNERKKERALIEFIDMELYTRSLFYDADGKVSDFAKSLAEEYDEIYIDEYQDVNELQNSIFEALNRDNTFVVGDVKQSIYGFRGACPAIFSARREQYRNAGPEENREGIFFTDNYRCNKGIVELVNQTAKNTLNNCPDMVKYLDDDDLVCKAEGEKATPQILLISKLFDPDAAFGIPSNDVPDAAKCEAQTDEKTEKSDKQKDRTEDELEAICMARSVASLLASGKYKGSDIAILVRSMTPADRIRKALEKENVPVSILCGKGFFETPEIQLMRSLLEAIDAPTKDIALAAAMRSPVFGFSLERLAEIAKKGSVAPTAKGRTISLRQKVENCKNNGDADCGRVLQFLDEYRFCAKEMTAPELIYRLIDRLKLIPLLSYGESAARASEIKDNLLFFYDLSGSVSDGNSGDLSAVLDRIARMAETDDVGKSGGETSEDRVRVMTVHGSKGLEFKVCWLYGTMNPLRGSSDKITVSSEFGPKMKVNGDDFRSACVITEADVAVEKANRDKELNEELRLLYVAMTRAKERLYISGKLTGVTGKDREKARENAVNALKAYALPGHCREMLERVGLEMKHLMYGLGDKIDEGLVQINVDTLPPELKIARPKQTSAPSAAPDAEEVEKYRNRLEFVYPHRYLTDFPAKKAVSALTPTVLDEDGDPLDLLSSEEGDSLGEVYTETPAFILKEEGKDAATAAEHGTATHAFMQFCSFENLEKNGVDAELKRLVDERFLSKEIANLVSKAQITAFLHSDLFVELKKALAAGKLRREQRFMITLPAKDFTDDPEKQRELAGEELLVQGVIDGFYEDDDGEIVLFDYKTDRFGKLEKTDPAECERLLTERHREQLGYYKIAIETMTDKKVKKSLLYSFSLGKSVIV